MTFIWTNRAILLAALCATSLPALAQQTSSLRAPSTPLIVHDPYFSVWSASDRLTDSPTRHWTGARQPINGLVRIDGINFRYLGEADRSVPALEEIAREITATRTVVHLQSPTVDLTLTFLTPAFPDDLKVMARPVTYLTWTAKSRDGVSHDVSIYLDASGSLATNHDDESVNWSRAEIPGLHLLKIGSAKQPILEQFGDNLRINWGSFYLGIPQAEGQAELVAGNETDREQFLKTGHILQQDDLDQPRPPQSRYPAAPSLSTVLLLGSVGTTPVSRHILVAYDDIYPVEYMHQRLLPYWRTEFSSFAALLQGAEHDYSALNKRAEHYDAELQSDLVKAGGAEYAAISILAFRQSIAAHKLVQDGAGILFFMPKENFSNGSISTVDVIYPSAPMYLFLNPKLVEAQMEPVMRYAQSGRWKFPFAPHDLGVYPLANGQLYGGGELTEDNQMPVEESGDLILLVAAVSQIEHSTTFAAKYWPLLTKWAKYLLAKGFDPENQLSTDDFAGHLAHNTNLSIKAIEALGAYAQLAEKLHDPKAGQYASAARSMAAKWPPQALEGDHYKLAFDQPNTWSQKYNLVWDRILNLNLFPPAVAEKEIAYYKTRLNQYGFPLDNRETYTKLDWEIWSATLATNPEDFKTLVKPIYQFLNATPDRVPMNDWYDTKSAKEIGFQARSVVGGVYIKMLADPELWKKWASRAK